MQYWTQPGLAVAPSVGRIWRNLLPWSAVFLGGFALAVHPDIFDRPVVAFTNGYVGRWPLLDKTAAAAYTFPTLSGCVLMALIWVCWVEAWDTEQRARILIGTLASFGAGIISRTLQRVLDTHVRPVYDKALDFQQIPDVNVSYNTWNSFPSDHVSVFAALALIIWLASRRLGVFAIVFTTVFAIDRIYVGGHFPSDLIGALGLAGMTVWISQTEWFVSIGRWLMRFERSKPSVFYPIAFFISAQIASLFLDVRNAAVMIRGVF
jgi:undecaprenyl-diphosphatase